MIKLSQRIVDVETLADYFGCTPRNIQLWVSDHGAPKMERGEYDLDEFIKWYIEHIKRENEKLKMGDATLYKLEQEDKRIITMFRKIKLMKELKNLVDIDLVSDAYARDMIAFKSEIENFRAYIKTSVGLTDDQKDSINKKIDEILIRLGTELKLDENVDEDLVDEIDEAEIE